MWQVGEDQAAIEGSQAIRQLYASLAQRISWSIHYFFPSVIEIGDDGVSARASFYILDFQTLENEAGEDEAYMFAGTFTDVFKKVDGSRYFQSVRGKIDVVTPWTESWTSKPFIPDFFRLKSRSVSSLQQT